RGPPAKCWASSRAGHVEAPSPSSTRLATRRTTTRSWCAPSLHDGSGRGRGSRGGAAGRLPVAVAHGEEPAQRPDVRRAVGPEGDRGPVVVVAEARAREDLVDRLTRAEVDRGEIVGVGPPRPAPGGRRARSGAARRCRRSPPTRRPAAWGWCRSPGRSGPPCGACRDRTARAT